MTADDRSARAPREGAVGLLPEDVDVRKASARLRRAGTAQSRRSIAAAAELLGGISNASAEAFRSLNLALTPEAVTRSGLAASVYTGLRDGNVRFLEELSETSRRVFDTLRPPPDRTDHREPGQPAGPARDVGRS